MQRRISSSGIRSAAGLEAGQVDRVGRHRAPRSFAAVPCGTAARRRPDGPAGWSRAARPGRRAPRGRPPRAAWPARRAAAPGDEGPPPHRRLEEPRRQQLLVGPHHRVAVGAQRLGQRRGWAAGGTRPGRRPSGCAPRPGRRSAGTAARPRRGRGSVRGIGPSSSLDWTHVARPTLDLREPAERIRAVQVDQSTARRWSMPAAPATPGNQGFPRRLTPNHFARRATAR